MSFLSLLTGSFSTPAADNPTVAVMEAAYRNAGLDARYLNCEVQPAGLLQFEGARSKGRILSNLFESRRHGNHHAQLRMLVEEFHPLGGLIIGLRDVNNELPGFVAGRDGRRRARGARNRGRARGATGQKEPEECCAKDAGQGMTGSTHA